MGIVGRFVGRLLLCGLASALVVGCGGGLLFSYSFGCAMNSGCSGGLSDWMGLLVPIVLLAPVAIFVAGARSLDGSLLAAGAGGRARAGAVVGFLLAPLALIAVWLGLEELRVNASRAEFRAGQAQRERLASAPIDVKIARTELIKENGSWVTLSVTLRIANVPPEAGVYRFNFGHVRPDFGSSPFHLGSSFKLRYEAGGWIPYDYGLTETYPHAGDEVTVGVEMRRFDGAPAAYPPEAHVTMVMLDVRGGGVFFDQIIPFPPPQ